MMNNFQRFPMYLPLLIALCIAMSPTAASAQKKKAVEPAPTKSGFDTVAISGMAFRSLGPAITSGRVADLAVDPADPKRYFVAVASGGVWRTTNAGNTFDPVFDGEGSY